MPLGRIGPIAWSGMTKKLPVNEAVCVPCSPVVYSRITTGYGIVPIITKSCKSMSNKLPKSLCESWVENHHCRLTVLIGQVVTYFGSLFCAVGVMCSTELRGDKVSAGTWWKACWMCKSS